MVWPDNIITERSPDSDKVTTVQYVGILDGENVDYEGSNP